MEGYARLANELFKENRSNTLDAVSATFGGLQNIKELKWNIFNDKTTELDRSVSFSKTPFEEQIGYSFQNQKLRKQALTRISLRNSTEEGEKLEFLGDAVFNMLMWDILMARLPDNSKNEIIVKHRLLIKNKSQAQLALLLRLNEYLILHHSTSLTIRQIKRLTDIWKSPEPSSLTTGETKALADVLESLVGAVYVDGGYIAVRNLIENFLNLMIKKQVIGGILEGELLTTAHKPLINKPIATHEDRLKMQSLGSKTAILGVEVMNMASTEILLDHYTDLSLGILVKQKESFLIFIKQQFLVRTDLQDRLSNWWPLATDVQRSARFFFGTQYLVEGYPTVKNTLEQMIIKKMTQEDLKKNKIL